MNPLRRSAWRFTWLAVFVCFAPRISWGQSLQPDHLHEDIVAAEQAHAARIMAGTASPLTDRYDLKYHRLELTVDPAINYIRGAITSYLLPTVSGSDSLYFDLSDSLVVDSVRYHGQLVPFGHAGTDLLGIQLPGAIPVGGLDSITVWYQGRPAGTGFGSFIQSAHNNTPVIWTLSEPFGAKDWWPCKNGITDKIDSLDVLVTTPVGNRVAGNGLLVAVTPGPGVNTHHWRHRHPIATYLVAFAVTNYLSYSDFVPYNGDTLEMLNYVFPEDSAAFAYYTPFMIDVMQLYDSLFGIYPFQDEKYGHAQFLWGGGMEHQTMSFVVSGAFELCAHEMAHQWFGDKVTCGSWQDIWLNEGWATYCSGLCYEHGLGTLSWDDFKTQRINQVVSAPDGSVWCDDTTSVGRIFNGRLTYTKGAMVLHQLRWIIGDSAFFAATRNYLAAPSIAYDFARTDDFQLHMEVSSGRNLTNYFTDWYYGQGHPTYEVRWGQSGDTAVFELNQTASMPSSVPFFALPVPLRLSDGTRDTIVVLNNTVNGEAFQVPVSFPFTTVEFDPEHWLIAGPTTLVGRPEPSEAAPFVKVTPTLTDGEIHIFGSRLDEAQVYDLTGHLLLRQSLDRSTFSHDMDLSGLSAGMYWVRVQAMGKYITQKVVVY